MITFTNIETTWSTNGLIYILRSFVPNLKATGLKVGLLLNFVKPTIEIKRIVN